MKKQTLLFMLEVESEKLNKLKVDATVGKPDKKAILRQQIVVDSLKIRLKGL